MEKKYQVFVSSTYEDLKEERQAVIGALLECGFIPVGMEQFPASPLSQWDYITKMIESSDYYLLIVAERYGSVDPESNISYTEKEYHFAVEKGIPVLTFLHANPEDIPSGKCEKTKRMRDKLNSFREMLIKEKRLLKFYSDASDLKQKASLAFLQAVNDYPRPGWVRGNAVTESTQDIQGLRAENESMRQEISELRESLVVGSFNKEDQETQRISNDAGVLLVYAASSSNGEILVARYLRGTHISAKGWDFVSGGGHRVEARWLAAIDELLDLTCIESVGYKGEVYQVTHFGYNLADELKTSRKIDTENNPGEYLDN